jgi:hypothetical protein
VLVKLYVTPTDDDTLGHVKLIDVAFDETVVQDPVNVGAETSRSVQRQTTASCSSSVVFTKRSCKQRHNRNLVKSATTQPT